MKEQPIKAQLNFVAIEILERSIALPQDMKETPANFNFNINVTVQVNENDSLVIPRVTVAINEKEGGIQYGKIVVNNLIKVINLNDFLVKENGINHLNQELATKLSETAISTTRGVMWDSFRGTFLHGAILPIIDTSQGIFSKH